MAGQTFNSPQDRLNKYKHNVANSTLNVHAEEFIPMSVPVLNNQEDDVDFFTRECLKELSENPGDFSLIMVTFINEFTQYLKSEEQTKKLAVAITEMCLKNDNCRYMGVKLGSMMKAESSLFLSNLLNYCESKFCSVFTSLEGWDTAAVSNLVLYLGEIYVQFEDSGGKRYSIMVDVMVLSCENLLNSPTEEHICVLVNLLKLVGQSLQEDCSDRLAEIMTKLEKLSIERNFSERTSFLIKSLLKTHSEKWHLEEKLGAQDSVEEGCDDPEGAILYGPDGEIISVEETSFLNNCCEVEKDTIGEVCPPRV